MKALISMGFMLLLSATASADSLRVATYNLNYANRRGDQVLDAVSQADPDLICFQETTLQSEQFLRKHLAETHPHFHAAGHRGRYHAERFAFASRRELRDVTFTPPGAGLFGFHAAELEVSGVPIRVVNAHLTPFQLQRGGGVRDAMTSLSETEQDHQAEIDSIVRRIDVNRPTIILGDFNSLSTFVAPARLADLGMTDAFASIHEHADTHWTWTWPTRPIPLALRIDYIFHSAHFHTSMSEVIRREGSDHSLVFAELKFKEHPETGGVRNSDPGNPSSLPGDGNASTGNGIED